MIYMAIGHQIERIFERYEDAMEFYEKHKQEYECLHIYEFKFPKEKRLKIASFKHSTRKENIELD